MGCSSPQQVKKAAPPPAARTLTPEFSHTSESGLGDEVCHILMLRCSYGHERSTFQFFVRCIPDGSG